MPSFNEIERHYTKHTPEWFGKLFPGPLDIFVWRPKGFLASHCWLTLRKTHLQRCHIVPDALGGSNHPSNFVILTSSMHARCPNVSDPEIFIDWLIAERSKDSKQAVEAYKVVFPDLKLDDSFRIAHVLTGAMKSNRTLADIAGVQATEAFPQEGRNPYMQQAVLVKRIIDAEDGAKKSV